MSRRPAARASLLLLILAAAPAPTAVAGEMTLHVGPPALGSGGSNPVSIPPLNPLEYELEFASASGLETSASFSPGVFVGARSTRPGSGVYVGLGGGAVFDVNGLGPGGYASLGFDSSGKGLKFNVELKQAAGYDFKLKHVMTPYAIRMGVSWAVGGGGSSE